MKLLFEPFPRRSFVLRGCRHGQDDLLSMELPSVYIFAYIIFTAYRTSTTKQNRRANLFKGKYIPSLELCGLFLFFTYRYVFISLEVVLVAKNGFNAPKHEDLDVPNLQVIKAL